MLAISLSQSPPSSIHSSLEASPDRSERGMIDAQQESDPKSESDSEPECDLLLTNGNEGPGTRTGSMTSVMGTETAERAYFRFG